MKVGWMQFALVRNRTHALKTKRHKKNNKKNKQQKEAS